MTSVKSEFVAVVSVIGMLAVAAVVHTASSRKSVDAPVASTAGQIWHQKPSEIPAPSQPSDAGFMSTDNPCEAKDAVMLLYEITLMAPKRCTNFVSLPMDAKLKTLKAAGITNETIASAQCQKYRLDMRVRLEIEADRDPEKFCLVNREIYRGNPFFKHYITGSASKPKN